MYLAPLFFEAILVTLLLVGQRRIPFLSKNAVVVSALASFAIFHLMALTSIRSWNHSIIDVALGMVIYLAGVEVGWEAISKHLADVAFFGLGMTVLSTIATTLALIPFSNATTYFVLMAAIAYVPTDPVLVFNQLGRLQLPKRVLTVIQGESILNDPLALLIFAQAMTLLLSHRSGASGANGGQVISGIVNLALQLMLSLALGALCYLFRNGRFTFRILRDLSPIIGVLIYIGAEHFALSPYLPLFILGLFTSSTESKIVDLAGETSEIAVVVAVAAIVPIDVYSNLSAYAIALLLFVAVDLLFRPLFSTLYFKVRHGRPIEGLATGLFGLKGSLSLVIATETYSMAKTNGERLIVSAVAIALTLSLLTKGVVATQVMRYILPSDGGFKES
ncbi:MAG: cation:proton antiporter [Actinomycetota bacterium]|nr:cation:proton antiporter [Actinomycetota bacterium]